MALMTKEMLENLRNLASFPLVVYTMDELKKMTDNFDPMKFIAKGSNCLVYYGRQGWSTPRIVKLLDASLVQCSSQVFEAKASVLYKLDHEHVPRLIGYCSEEDNRALVYSHAVYGSLYDVLYGRKGIEGAKAGSVLTWAERTKIAYGAASGLEYLHEKVDPPIVYGDVRSSNVLLSYDFSTQIGDIDLKRVLPNDGCHGTPRASSTGALGSYGYNGPDYAATGEVTKKGDVYSFGVVLLELLTGRKPVDHTLPEEQRDLVAWATPYLSGDKVEQIVDPKLNGDYPTNAVAKVAALAHLCIQDEPDFRPNMSIIVKALEPLQIIPEAEIENPVKIFSMVDLNTATDNFSQMSLVSKGSYGWVFYGVLEDVEEAAAIKKLDLSISKETDADFAAQLSVVSRLKHDHFVKLLGYCLEKDNRFLVYEFATKGTLHDVLYGRKHVYGAPPGATLTWSQRAKIAYGAAKGLDYLHETVDPPIVHGDVRSSNVFLFQSASRDYYSKIGDFHLTSCPKDASTQKSDVYCFGVVLLELLTGRKPVDETLPEEQHDLVTWATPYLNAENVEKIIDPKLNGDFSLDEVAKVAALARQCTQDKPNMSIVVGVLETVVDV